MIDKRNAIPQIKKMKEVNTMKTYRITFTTSDRSAEFVEYIDAVSVEQALDLLGYERLGLILVDAYC